MIIFLFFKIKRFKDGFNFLKKNNDFIDLIIINLSIIVLFLYSISGIYFSDKTTKNLLLSFIVLSIFIFKSIIKINLNFIDIFMMVIIQIILNVLFFKFNRFRNGFNFLKKQNEFTDLIMYSISSILIFVYTIPGIRMSDNIENIGKQLFIIFLVFCIIMIIILLKTLVLNYKQKLLEKTVKEYEEEIKEKDRIIKEKTEENFKFSKINHEFYNRQKSLQLAVKEFVNNNNLNIEASEEIISNIENLTKEYSEKQKETKSLNQLPKTEILEIDNMFKYMQEEANKNNIEFNLQINGNIFYMINNIIPENLLTTLIGDHIRDAIIAINSSENKFKSIMAILGIKEKYYEFCIYDSGIEFEIDTLLKLGLEPVTTHKEEGGTGIGFITTFETLNKTKASLIIEEKGPTSEKDYTKAVIIRFDNKNEYKIKSYRAEQIKNKQKDNRIIIEN